jgi:hypothetical protein
MRRQSNLRAKDFVLEINGRAILVFRAGSMRAALGFCAQEWFVSELASYRSDGCHLWSGHRDFSIRRATRKPLSCKSLLRPKSPAENIKGTSLRSLSQSMLLPIEKTSIDAELNNAKTYWRVLFGAR